MVMNEIYCYNKCGGGGLEIIKLYRNLIILMENDKLTVLCDITVHV